MPRGTTKAVPYATAVLTTINAETAEPAEQIPTDGRGWKGGRGWIGWKGKRSLSSPIPPILPFPPILPSRAFTFSRDTLLGPRRLHDDRITSETRDDDLHAA